MNKKPHTKLKEWARNYLRKPLNYYYFKFDEQTISAPKNENVGFFIIDTWERLQKEFDKYKLECNEDFRKKIDDGAKIAFLADDENIFSTGWLISNCSNFQVDYNKSQLFIGESVILLFNFQTYSKHQKKGYYQTLLVKILEAFKNHNFYIYTSPANIGIHKGILGSGFVEQGTFLRINNRKLFKKLKELKIDIRKGKRLK